MDRVKLLFPMFLGHLRPVSSVPSRGSVSRFVRGPRGSSGLHLFPLGVSLSHRVSPDPQPPPAAPSGHFSLRSAFPSFAFGYGMSEE